MADPAEESFPLMIDPRQPQKYLLRQVIYVGRALAQPSPMLPPQIRYEGLLAACDQIIPRTTP